VTRRAAISSVWALAVAAGLTAVGAIRPAFAQDEAPVGPSATIGALGAAPEAPEVPEAPAAPSAAVPAEEEVAPLPAAAATAVASAPSMRALPPVTAAPPGPASAPTAASGAAASASGAEASAPTALAAPAPAAATAGALTAAALAAAVAPSEAAAPKAAAPAEDSRTFLVNDGATGSTASGWSPVAPGAAPSSAPGAMEDAAAAAAGAVGGTPDPATNSPAPDDQGGNPDHAPSGTTVIPSAQEQMAPPVIVAPSSGSQIVNYQENQQMPLNEPQLHSLQEFMNEGVNTSPLGVELQEGARRTKNGREVDGLLVVALQPGSPAELAGVQAGHRVAHDVLEGAAVAASLVFPPAVLAVPVIETIQLGENYDLIIGVDGNRVTNFMDFQDQLRDAQPGETVYLNILRSGKRLQVPVQMPPTNAAKLEP